MEQEKKDRMFYELLQNSLLHLYQFVSETPRFVPNEKRNKILTSYFKDQMVNKELKQIKSFLRVMIATGRSHDSILEKHTWSLINDIKPKMKNAASN
jgi:hypothetical protein